MDFSDLCFYCVERNAKRTGQLIVGGEKRWPFGPQDTEIQLRGKEGDLQSITRRRVAVGLRDAMDETLEPQPAEVIRHLRGRIRVPEEGFHARTQFAVAEAARKMGQAGDGLK